MTNTKYIVLFLSSVKHVLFIHCLLTQDKHFESDIETSRRFIHWLLLNPCLHRLRLTKTGTYPN